MIEQISRHQVFSHFQLLVDQFQNVTLIGFRRSQEVYQALMFDYAKTPSAAQWPLKDLVRKLGPFKEFSQVKKITSKYSKVVYVKGILGVIKLLYGYYLLYIEQASAIGSISNRPIYKVDKVSILPLFRKFNDLDQSAQNRHFQLLSTYEFNDLYFSYNYDLSSTLLQNSNGSSSQQFVWNYYMKQELSLCVGPEWVPNVIQGFVKCKQQLKAEFNSKPVQFSLAIIARRSRHQSGTRYLKRGINAEGHVANYVETEQIVIVGSQISSFLMVRGSVPVFWKQEASIVVFQPKIVITHEDPEFLSAQKHFRDMARRYGANIHCINLLRVEESKPREGLLTKIFKELVQEISSRQKHGLYYYEFDVKKEMGVLEQFQRNVAELSYYLLMQTGVYRLGNGNASFQHGVARINCVDCLDRTNLFMSIMGEVALNFQLKHLLGQDLPSKQLGLNKQFLRYYGSIHENLGNAISLQYGGSEAHKHRHAANKSELMVSLIRHINNNTSDYTKQQQIDICNGLFSRTKPFIWDRDSKQNPTGNVDSSLKTRKWMDQAQNEYLTQTASKNMIKSQGGVLSKLREEFMDSKISSTHISLRRSQTVWGSVLDYRARWGQVKRKSSLKDQIDKFNSQPYLSQQSRSKAESSLYDVIIERLETGKIQDSELEITEPFILRMKRKNLI